jgi:hypothetical protein
MGNIVLDMSMSLDGFITGPDDGPENGLGVDGHRLHHPPHDQPRRRDAAVPGADVDPRGGPVGDAEGDRRR